MPGERAAEPGKRAPPAPGTGNGYATARRVQAITFPAKQLAPAEPTDPRPSAEGDAAAFATGLVGCGRTTGKLHRAGPAGAARLAGPAAGAPDQRGRCR